MPTRQAALSSPSEPLASASAEWLRLPLTKPYENALGRIEAFDVLLVAVRDRSGRIGWGEACPVEGYSPETPKRCWSFFEELIPSLPGCGRSAAAQMALRYMDRLPFAASAVIEALEDLADDPALRAPMTTELDLVGTVNTLDATRAPAVARELVAAGHRTLKVKVGYDAPADARRVAAIAEAVGDSARLRVDANQGYRVPEAIAFARAVPGDAIEVFEQPVDAEDWAGMQAVAGACGLPVMLDEAIYGDADIRRAGAIAGVAAVKLKLSKAGGAAGLVRQVALARALGLKVVAGNGVASDLGCLHELLACRAADITTAGEMNGFVKTEARLVDIDLSVSAGRITVPAVADTPVRDDRRAWRLARCDAG
jgi:o-succinylbenzoate synthase